MFTGAALLSNCTPRAVENPPPPAEVAPDAAGVELRAPHWDQPCFDARQRTFLRLEEVVDTAGLDPWPAGAREAARGRRPRAHVDVALSLERSGAIRSVHLQGHTTDTAVAERVVAEVAAAARATSRLLEPVRLRIRIHPGPRRRFQILPPEFCMPHIQHDEAVPRWEEGTTVRVGRLSSAPDDGPVIGILVEIARDGAVTGVEHLSGNPRLMERVRSFLASVIIDPALLNGEAVPGELHLVLRFRPPAEAVPPSSSTPGGP